MTAPAWQPTTAAALLALAERCEAAGGPDHVLDAEIFCALSGATIHEDTDPASGHFAFWGGAPWKSLCCNCSSWGDPTGSVDMAMLLVPEGWKIAHISQVDTDKPLRQWFAELRHGFVTSYDKALPIWAATPALALTAAALRAHAASVDTHPKDGDAVAAPLVSGAVGEAETPKVQP